MSELLPNPCHLLDTAWLGLDDSAGYSDISVDITVDHDPGEEAGYFYANTVYFLTAHVDDRGALTGAAYAGLQTNGYSGPAGRVGKMALFSAWGATGGLAEEGGWTSEFDENGIGYSVRAIYRWQEGVSYTLRIGLDDEEDDHRIWSASLTDPSGDSQRIGRVLVPNSFGKIRRPITFHERYLGPSQTVDEVETSAVRFENMRAEGGRFRSSRWRHTKVASVDAHPGFTFNEDLPTGVRTGVGRQR